MYPANVSKLIEYFKRFPTIGPKSAERIIFHLLKEWSTEDVERFAQAMVASKRTIRHCKVCCNISETEICSICSSPKRDQGVICVVTDEKSQTAIERAKEFKGTYHILGGVLSPMDGVGVDDLNINALIHRVKEKPPQELIFALPPEMRAETTMLLIAQMLKPFVSNITRISFGIPANGELEYADDLTISRALSDRRSID